MNLQSKKEFFRQLCRTVGHAETRPNGRCSRCQKRIAGYLGSIWGVEVLGMTIRNTLGIAKIQIYNDPPPDVDKS